MSWLDRFKAALSGKPRCATDLAEDVKRATVALSEAQTQRAELAAQLAGRLADPKSLPAHHAAVAEADAQVREAEALLRSLEARYAETFAAEVEAKRQEAYDHAVEAVGRAESLLRKNYPKAGEMFAEMARAVRDADRAVALAHAALPAGASYLKGPEELVRDQQTVVGGAVRTRVEVRWVPELQSEPLTPEALVTETGPNAGVWEGPRGLTKVHRARFSVVERRAHVTGLSGLRIADLTIPGLRFGEPAYVFPPMLQDPDALDRSRAAFATKAEQAGGTSEVWSFLEFLPTAEAA